jgi:hypothetical protein
MGQYATDAGRVVEFSANGSSPARTPGSVSNGDGASLNHRLSFDSIADDRLERSSIAESEGCHPSLSDSKLFRMLCFLSSSSNGTHYRILTHVHFWN